LLGQKRVLLRAEIPRKELASDGRDLIVLIDWEGDQTALAEVEHGERLSQPALDRVERTGGEWIAYCLHTKVKIEY
jgi:hypothetical protein